MIDKNKLYRKQEIANTLGVHVNTITNNVRTGKLTPHYLGRIPYFHGNEILNALGINGVSGTHATNEVDNQ